MCRVDVTQQQGSWNDNASVSSKLQLYALSLAVRISLLKYYAVKQNSLTVALSLLRVDIECFLLVVASPCDWWRSHMEKFSVQKVIGEGSFGRALLVRCKDSQETLVIKEIQLPKVISHSECDALPVSWWCNHNATNNKFWMVIIKKHSLT